MGRPLNHLRPLQDSKLHVQGANVITSRGPRHFPGLNRTALVPVTGLQLRTVEEWKTSCKFLSGPPKLPLTTVATR